MGRGLVNPPPYVGVCLMTEWIDSFPFVSQKVLRAVCKGIMRIPTTTYQNASLVFSCLKMTKRLQVHEKQKDTLTHMVKTFGLALCKSASPCRRHEQPVDTW